MAPGTWGSAAVAAIYLLVAWGSGSRQVCLTGTMAAIAVAFSVICLALGRFAEETFGRKDPSQVSADEWAGQAVALMLLPVGRGPADLWLAVGVAFVAFRVMDIIKPPPANGLQRLKGGLGILIDDLVAGVYANVLAQLVLRWVARASCP